MEMVGIARSYFGGFLCVCWSPDGKYIVVGGEDDLVTVYSFTEKRVVARGQGHRSWVSVVAFDPYTTLSSWDQNDFSDDENNQYDQTNGNTTTTKRTRSASIRDSTLSSATTGAPDSKLICYRLGSVSQDTQLCLWDITEDVLRPHHRVRLSTLDPTTNTHKTATAATEINQIPNGDCSSSASGGGSGSSGSSIIHKDSNNEHSLSNNLHTTITNVNNSSSNKLATNNSEDVMTTTTTVNTKKVIGNSSNNNSSNSSATAKVSNTIATTTSEAITNNHHHHHSSSAFNTLTQRLTNFSFGGSDKSSKGSKKSFSLTGSGSSKGNSVEQKSSGASDGNTSLTLRNKSGSITTTFDAMKLIGSPACPRFEVIL